MPDTGVSDIAIYIPEYYLALEDLAAVRGVPAEKYHVGLGNYKMSIVPPWEDAVTMAANATIQLLKKTGIDPSEISQIVVSTESSVDYSKAIASFVQGLLGFGSRCRVYEIKHACYGGTAGLVNSIDRISRYVGSKQKGIVIMTDIAKYGLGSQGEPTQGAGAIALLVERNPCLFSIDTSLNGIFSKDVYDFWRPTGCQFPIVEGKYSIECYFMALEGVIEHFRENVGIKRGNFLDYFDYLIYHMPFANMAKKAHKHLIDIDHKGKKPEEREDIYEESFPRMVLPGLMGAREVGNIYTGSVYMGVMSLLELEGKKAEGKRLGIFSYGSGCGAEFFLCHLNLGIKKIIDKFNIQQQLDERKRVSFEEYEKIYSETNNNIVNKEDVNRLRSDSFDRVFYTGMENQKRQYIVSKSKY